MLLVGSDAMDSRHTMGVYMSAYKIDGHSEYIVILTKFAFFGESFDVVSGIGPHG